MVLTLIHFVLSFSTYFLIKPRDMCTRPHKFALAFLVLIFEALTFFYLLKIYIVFNYHDTAWGIQRPPRSYQRQHQT